MIEAPSEILDTALIPRLRRLQLAAGTVGEAASRGIRRSRALGSSVEFADFREYLPGDDFRFVDWNAYARFDRLYIKQYHEESSLNVVFVIDDSPSMDFGEPSKLAAARRIAAGLSVSALAQYDCVGFETISGADRLQAGRGKRRLITLLERLGKIEAKTPSDFNMSLRRLSERVPRNAYFIVISDFLCEEGYREGLEALLYRKARVGLIGVMAPEELSPRFGGDWLLEDAETGRTVDVTSSPRLFERYQEELRSHCDGLRNFSRRHRLPFAMLPSNRPPEKVFFEDLKAF